MSNRMYIINSAGHVELCPDLSEWGAWMAVHDEERHLAVSEKGIVKVSTLFLGLDHGYGTDSDAPILWETRILRGIHDGETTRYSTKEEALKGHEKMVEMAFGGKG